MTTYHQEVILAMDLDRSHIGKLVQIITESWSMTGTLTRVDQHDNREWRIEYPSTLVPSGGEIYATLHIGPWVGDVIGNQPVTVETVKGTLEAPETATRAVTRFIMDEEMAEARGVIEGTAVELPAAYSDDVVHGVPDHSWTYCGRKVRPVLPGLRIVGDVKLVTCPSCLAEIQERAALPPEPPAEWHKH